MDSAGQREKTSTMHDLIVHAVAGSYQIEGHEAVPYWNGSSNGHKKPDLVIPALRRVEEIETDETLPSLEQSKIDHFVDQGMEVWLIVPLSKLGYAHDRFRGQASRVQAWWVKDGRICFGRPEAL